MTSHLKLGLMDLPLDPIQDGQVADAIDLTTPFDEAAAEALAAHGRASIRPTDLYSKHLMDALVGVSGQFAVTQINAGADEQLRLNLDASAAVKSAVPTASGAATWDWQRPTSDIPVVAGEAIAARALVYVNSSGIAYKIDPGTQAIGQVRGVAPEAIGSGAAGLVRLYGVVGGFSGLTAWRAVYAAASGGYTQTRPAPAVGGAQVALARLGFAVSATDLLVAPERICYQKRASLAPDDTLTLVHHAQAETRRPRAFISATAAVLLIDQSAAAGQMQLRAQAGAGETQDYTGDQLQGSGYFVGRNPSLQDGWVAAMFNIGASGSVSEIAILHGANAGTPTGTITWEIRASTASDSTGEPTSTVLASGTYTPAASALNTLAIANGIFLSAGTIYWLVLRPTSTQSTGTYWLIRYTTTASSPPNKTTTTSGSTWLDGSGRAAIRLALRPVLSYDRLAQSFQIGGDYIIDFARLYLRKVGAPAGIMTLRIETDNAGVPSGTLANANATVTLAEAALTTSFDWVEFNFAVNFALSAATVYWLVLSTDRTADASNFVEPGVSAQSVYPAGQMRGEASAVWSALTRDMAFRLGGNGDLLTQPCVLGRWSGGTRTIAAVFDDGSGNNSDTTTTFKNVSGGALDVTCEVEFS